MATMGVKQDYNQFIDKLHQQGLKTTYINTAAGEANFSTYGNALSQSMQNEIMDSFNTEEDYKMQAEIAGLFKGKGSNFMDSSSFVSSCKNLGYNVKVEYRSTSYIRDYKSGNFSNTVGNGAIAFYTISDGQGGEIKIADANGNGGLETEEIFMNNILGDVMKDMSIPTNSAVSGSHATSGSNSSNKSEKDKEEKVTQEDFNEKVDEYLKRGYTKALSSSLAAKDLGKRYSYTGTLAAKLEKEEEKKKDDELLTA